MGGNYIVDGNEANRIDINCISRKEIVKELRYAFTQLSNTFKSYIGVPIWSDELLTSNEYLSGSATHLFNVAEIDDDTFKKYKPSVGDIDIQVDKNLETKFSEFFSHLKLFRVNNSVPTYGDLSFIGSKKSAGQFITLWSSSKFKINIQVDFELVDYENGVTSSWARFSHSSPWVDIKHGIKGVAHKYLLRALCAKSLQEVIVLTGKKMTPKKVISSELAFSVQHGLRKKLERTTDLHDNPISDNSMGVYCEIPVSDSTYITDVKAIFKEFFNFDPLPVELTHFESFVGLVDLCKLYNSQSDNEKILRGFIHTLWGKNAQFLYRNDMSKDFFEKRMMFEYISSQFRLYNISILDDISLYYKGCEWV